MVNPFSHLEDEKLMELYKNGENMAFEIIYERYNKNVYTYLTKRCSDKNQIDDLFQCIFVKFHRSKHLYDSKYPVLAWIYTIARSEFLDFLKKKKINLVSLPDHETREVVEESSQPFEIDIDAETTLSEKEKMAIKLRYFSDEDFTEISKILYTTDANSRKIISRGIQKLKTKYLGVKNAKS